MGGDQAQEMAVAVTVAAGGMIEKETGFAATQSGAHSLALLQTPSRPNRSSRLPPHPNVSPASATPLIKTGARIVSPTKPSGVSATGP